MKNPEAVYQQLKKVISDKSRILTNMEDLWSYSFDASFGSYMPEFVVQVI